MEIELKIELTNVWLYIQMYWKSFKLTQLKFFLNTSLADFPIRQAPRKAADWIATFVAITKRWLPLLTKIICLTTINKKAVHAIAVFFVFL